MDISAHLGYRGIDFITMFNYVWAVELNRYGLEFVGLWPKTDEVANNDLRAIVTFILVTFFCFIPLLCSLVRVWNDMIFIIDNLQATLPVTVVLVKLIIMWWKRKGASLIMRMIAEDWIEVKVDADRDVMIRRAQSARLIVICGYVSMLFTYIMIIILPAFGLHFRYITNFTDGNKELPLQTYYFYDTSKSPQFELTYAVQALSMFLGVITYTSVDAFFGLAIFHICGQMENFKRRMLTLISNKNFDCALRNNVKIHLRLHLHTYFYRFANNVEDTFAFMMLGLVFYFAIVFCLYGFVLVSIISGNDTNNISVSRKCFAVLVVVILLSYTLLYCAAGEIVTEQCEALYRTLCDLEWYKLESRKQSVIILLMLRANKPFRITAGKLFPLTVSTFCSLLKTSAGYISFLLAMSE
ncbi:odorant receptor 22c-like [Pseudomyrmex gracilis]|uniref:odorant receptor 22c-like n=1 Tax=Pseudomyrmex gracilis TaxID=219809 RepID=UPI0009951DAE|nr:odorant receptor 22c-like [Pseudomyrmex gracilis]